MLGLQPTGSTNADLYPHACTLYYLPSTFSVPMPMVNIREMWMRMNQLTMLVPMRMRLPRRIIRPVHVLMVLVVNVRMFMFQRFVLVDMLMPLRQMQPNPRRHQSGRRQQPRRYLVPERRNRNHRAD